MVRILVVPERLQGMSHQMAQVASFLRDLDGRLGRAVGGLDWEVRQQANIEGQVQAARSQARALAERAEAMARFLSERAAAFQQADADGVQHLGAVMTSYLHPAPVPTPSPVSPVSPATSNEQPFPFFLGEVVQSLDDLLKPVDWVTDSRQASRAFDAMLADIGRLLNQLTGQRGHIKMMEQLGEFLKDSTRGVDFLSNLLDAQAMQRYFSGQMTNAQIADVAIKVLVPIPILNDHLAQWLVQNMPDPNGHWHGLVGQVE